MAQYTSDVSDSTVLQILTECGKLSSHPPLLLNCRVLWKGWTSLPALHTYQL